MLAHSDTNIEDAASLILGQNYDVEFLVPTETGLSKSIIDAHDAAKYSIIALFERGQLHDYKSQTLGVIRKITAQFITSDETYEKKVSLYRPKTKKGDPRIWISGLNKLAKADNLIALIVINQELFIVNCSDKVSLKHALEVALPKVKVVASDIANELLHKLVKVSNKGFIRTIKSGDTGVGMTLESELGIPPNASRKPDYKGIELKTTRAGVKLKDIHAKGLFGCVPNWKISPLKSTTDILNKRSYIDSKGRIALRHTVSAVKPNSLGLFLDIDYINGYLRQMFDDVKVKDFNPEHDTTWVFQHLKERLAEKHKETFWIKGLNHGSGNSEKFHYVEAEHTMNPYISKFETLIETGIITVDYTMHFKDSGAARDHGYLFKLKRNHLTSLFPEAIKYNLRA